MAQTSTSSTGITFLRTPDQLFAGVADFAYEPHDVEVDGLRMAYVDVGPSAGPVILLLHGEPTWGYLYRRMIPPLVEAGFRCVVPDLIGFGRSDKPVDRSVRSASSAEPAEVTADPLPQPQWSRASAPSGRPQHARRVSVA